MTVTYTEYSMSQGPEQPERVQRRSTTWPRHRLACALVIIKAPPRRQPRGRGLVAPCEARARAAHRPHPAGASLPSSRAASSPCSSPDLVTRAREPGRGGARHRPGAVRAWSWWSSSAAWATTAGCAKLEEPGGRADACPRSGPPAGPSTRVANPSRHDVAWRSQSSGSWLLPLRVAGPYLRAAVESVLAQSDPVAGP